MVRRDGAIYFTDTYGAFRLREKDPRRELDFNAVYMWKDGKLTLVVKDMPTTNGLAFSPDEDYLYVNGGRDNYVNRYDVRADGALVNGKLFIDMRKETGGGVTDGLRVDTKGNLYDALGGVWIISPEGKHLGTIRAGSVDQCGIRRRRQEDALHRGAHGHLQDQSEHAGHLKEERSPLVSGRVRR